MKQKISTFFKKNPDLLIGLGIVVVGGIIGILFKLLLPSQPLMATQPLPLPQAEQEMQELILDTGVFGEIQTHSSEDGEIVIGGDFVPVPMSITKDPETIWEKEQYTGNFTAPQKATQKDGSMGVLTIQRIGLSTNVYESKDDMSTLGNNVAHFPSTSAWDGNIGVSAHNINLNGSNGQFLNLYQLQQGDTIQYKTALGERIYQVTTVRTISGDDWSYLSYSDENKITLITCITGQPDNRLVVQAVESGIA